jgi:hypothetical protein
MAQPGSASDPNKLAEWNRQSGARFIVLFGVASLFADLIHEGAPSATRPFLETLGATGPPLFLPCATAVPSRR